MKNMVQMIRGENHVGTWKLPMIPCILIMLSRQLRSRQFQVGYESIVPKPESPRDIREAVKTGKIC